MFDKLIDFLIGFIDKALPIVIVNEYDGGVLLRGGKFVKVLTGGAWYFKIPFWDEPITTTVVTTTMALPEQSLTTKDGKQVVVSCIVKYSVGDVKILLLETFDANDAISDTTQGIIKQVITESNYKEITNDIDKEITTKARREAKRWGVDIDKVTLTNFGEIISVRLFNDNQSV